MGIVNENMIADYVILDARMIKNLPRKIAAATGVDALAHCIECFTSNKANPFSDLYALEGLDLILNNIEKACDDPEAMAEKNRMQIAAYYGGLAITASGTTAVHALSYPLGGKYHIAHGVSNAILLAQHHKVLAVDIIPEKVELINQRKSPIIDAEIQQYLAEKDLDLTATLDGAAAYRQADFVIIAAPTNYDSRKNFFDTSAVEAVIELVLSCNPDAVMVIKSTVPVGYTQSVREKYHCQNILFSPEFLREGRALYDNLYPSRIIVGTDAADETLTAAAHTFSGLLREGAIKEEIPHAVYGLHRGRGSETVRQHLPGAACQLLQRTGHLCRNERAGYPADHRRRLPGSPYRRTL